MAVGPSMKIPKTSELVANYIREQIVRGELSEGDSLPPEGKMIASLGISRPTLREAFRILEAENLISVARGSRTGARVQLPSVHLVSRYAGYVLQAHKTTIGELYDARLAIEPHAVRRLAASRDPEHLEKMRHKAAELEEAAQQQDFASFYAGVDAFHGLIVELTGNRVLTFMNQLLLRLISQHQREYLVRHPRSQNEQVKSLRAGARSYFKLIDLIAAGDVQAAIDHWRLHLQNANAVWLGGREGERIVDALNSPETLEGALL